MVLGNINPFIYLFIKIVTIHLSPLHFYRGIMGILGLTKVCVTHGKTVDANLKTVLYRFSFSNHLILAIKTAAALRSEGLHAAYEVIDHI